MNRLRPGRPANILLVEDNPGDVDLVLDVLGSAALPPNVVVAADGVEALERLRAPRDLPDLIILDLNLPRKDGRTVLREIKAEPKLRAIPVIVLSSSEADRDLRDSYDLHANCFVTKPPELDDFFTAVRGIVDFWLHVARLPPSREAEAM